MVEVLLLITSICILILFIFLYKEKEQTRRTLNALQWKLDMIHVNIQRVEDQLKKVEQLTELLPKPPTEEQLKEAQLLQQAQADKLQKLINEYLG